MKFEFRTWNGAQVIERKRFSVVYGPNEPKNIKNLLLKNGNQHMKFEVRRWNGPEVIVRKRFSLVYRPLWSWPLTPKTIGIFFSIRAISFWSFKSVGETVLKLSSGNGFKLTGPCDLDLWPTDPSNERNLLLNKAKQHMKFEVRRWNGTQVIIWKRFSAYSPLWPWPFTYWPQ